MPLLEVTGVSKRFGGVHAVKDVSFRVETGTIKAVIGPNGAGKTTLFNLVSGFIAPDAGAVTFAGERDAGPRAASRSPRSGSPGRSSTSGSSRA